MLECGQSHPMDWITRGKRVPFISPCFLTVSEHDQFPLQFCYHGFTSMIDCVLKLSTSTPTFLKLHSSSVLVDVMREVTNAVHW